MDTQAVTQVETEVAVVSSAMEQQLKWEQDCAQAGASYYKQQTASSRENETETFSGYGRQLICRHIKAVADAIDAAIKASNESPGRKAIAMVMLQKVDSKVAATIALRNVVNAVSSRKPFTTIATRTASELRDEIRFSEFEKAQPKLFDQVQRNLDKDPQKASIRVRRRKLEGAIEKYNVAIAEMDDRELAMVGGRLVEIVIESTGLVEIAAERNGNRTVNYLVAKPELIEWIDAHIEQSSLLSPMYLPTLIPPKAWSNTRDGGYYTSSAPIDANVSLQYSGWPPNVTVYNGAVTATTDYMSPPSGATFNSTVDLPFAACVNCTFNSLVRFWLWGHGMIKWDGMANSVFNDRVSFCTQAGTVKTTVYSPSSPSVAPPNKVAVGTSNLGVPGTMAAGGGAKQLVAPVTARL